MPDLNEIIEGLHAVAGDASRKGEEVKSEAERELTALQEAAGELNNSGGFKMVEDAVDEAKSQLQSVEDAFETVAAAAKRQAEMLAEAAGGN